MDTRNQQDLYRIGTVASLTGLSVERLRAWERRYDLSPAHKDGRTRFYSKQQLDRLKLIKHLIDQGQPISSLAPLSIEQLQGRIEGQANTPGVVAAHKPKVGLVGPNLLMLEAQSSASDQPVRLDVVARWANLSAFEEEQEAAISELQILILQMPVLSQQPIDLATELYPTARVIAVYQFATSKAVSDLQAAGLQTLKWPLNWTELEHIAISELGLPPRAQRSVPRRYSDEELIAIAASVEDETNCPQYLVEAINQLNAFATYADDCRHAVPRAAPYERLHTDATQARAQLEVALESLIEALENPALRQSIR